MAEAGDDGTTGSVAPGAITRLLRDLVGTPCDPELPTLDPGTFVGRFELVREIGRGGFSVVWEARDGELGRKVALKLIRPGGAGVGDEEARNEAETIARLQHPHLVTLFDAGRSEHGPYLVLELLRGETLQHRLARGPLPVPEALAIAIGVARGLAHAHGEGVIHRDLKPSNVFLCGGGALKVLDFGIAHAFGHRRVSGGTSAYMSPEQWREAPEDERSDVFALGVMIYRMLTGTLPFPEDGGKSTCGPAPAPELEVPDVPSLGPAVARMLAQEPADRLRDGTEALAALEGAAAPAPADARPALVVVRRGWRRGGKASLGLGAAAAIALGTVAAMRSGAGAAPTTPPSVAVLPFTDLSAQHDQEYLSDGIAVEILDRLSTVEGLRVIGRTSSAYFKGRNVPLAEIAKTLGVTSVLEGSIRRDGDRIRVIAQLVNGADGVRVWSERYDRDIGGVFAIQDDVARDVAEALQVKLALKGAPTRTPVPEAYTEYLLARQLWRVGSTDDDEVRELTIMERSASLDPSFAPAWAGVAVLRGHLATGVADPTVRAAQEKVAWDAAARAIALSPGDGAGYTARAYLRSYLDMDWTGAEADLRIALRENPSNLSALVQSGTLEWVLGRNEEALSKFKRYVEREPLSANSWALLGSLQLGMGDLEGARAAGRRVREIAPEHWGVTLIADADLLDGRPARALELASGMIERRRLYYTTLAEHSLGHAAESDRALEVYVSRYGKEYPVDVAMVHAWCGRPDQAFEWLERTLTLRGKSLSAAEVVGDPMLASLHSDPRWATFRTRVNLPPE